MSVGYREFFKTATGNAPFPYQVRLAENALPDLVAIPTGLGKTAAVALAWLYRRLQAPQETPLRLFWCLPMRTLVKQTHASLSEYVERVAHLFPDKSALPTVELLMGGELNAQWAENPERPAIVIGTQDMLISRALMRGYGITRYRWPMHFAAINNSALWVFDETQLMGVAVETSAQLQALRDQLGTAAPTRSLWMSATLGRAQLATVDHPEPEEGWTSLCLNEDDHAFPLVTQRTHAKKSIEQRDGALSKKDASELGAPASGHRSRFAKALVEQVLEAHVEGTLTLVILNQVARAQAVYQALRDAAPDQRSALLHSRFRQAEREQHEALLRAEGDRIVIATQVVEAGVDVSAKTLFTELAPWPSLIQRFGRCNRYGEYQDANIVWLDIEVEADEALALPYSAEALQSARAILGELSEAGPSVVDAVSYTAPAVVRPVLRRRDLLELFDTTPDLAGNDLDVSRYIRDPSAGVEVAVFWRDMPSTQGAKPSDETAAPSRDELCSAPLGTVEALLKKKSVTGFVFDALNDQWVNATRLRPGQQVLIPTHCGGYDAGLGFTGVPAKASTPKIEELAGAAQPPEAMEDEARSVSDWIPLSTHLQHVEQAAEQIAAACGLSPRWTERLATAGRWHDVGKAHEVFQTMLCAPGEQDERRRPPRDNTLWAKSNHSAGRPARRGFRHELASALAYLQHHGDQADSAVAYLIAAHHGKIRLSIRSLPNEAGPPEGQAETLFARGVWHGDTLPALTLPSGEALPELVLDLTCMRFGSGSWLERTLALRDDPELGPFRLAWFEALLTLADWRASAAERAAAPTPFKGEAQR